MGLAIRPGAFHVLAALVLDLAEADDRHTLRQGIPDLGGAALAGVWVAGDSQGRRT